ncbi:MAG TPA: serine/threonine-protein kinase [Verrucomicrobiae bacterium]
MNTSDLPCETLFEGALNCPTPQQRAAYLDKACAGQPDLRRKLEALLQAHERSGDFLEPPAATEQSTLKLGLEREEPAGTLIGRYKLLQKIGEGGMGVVYMAEQTAPVVRRVALKIIKLGMDTKQVVARFEAERQALALMDHPNIAKVLDAGSTETGRPYFVMELVHGVPITEYCDKNKLSTRERLELFIPVCQAIQHAHQKGIIHRDINPSNVMVTLHDGVPVPKVIDFGVAKAINQRLTEKTLFTNYAQMIGTPAYMSPEQAEMSGLDIDTRTDVYSLGVLLYELLTGSTPFDAKELLSKGYAEIQRMIAEQEPTKPSTRMSTLTDEQRTVVAKNRSVEASALRKDLQGDLDWIVMKCLEKDRTRRYETSNGLAADLRRHLNNELITARAPTTGYLLRKLIKRNQLAFAAAAAVAGALVIGALAATWQAVRATRAEKLATERLAESEAITKFLTGVFQSPDPARDGRTITVIETLNRATTNLDMELADQPARRARLQWVLGFTYEGIGQQGAAITLLEKSRDYYERVRGPEDEATLEVMRQLASVYCEVGRLEQAIELNQAVLATRLRISGKKHPSTLLAMNGLAIAYQSRWRRSEAIKLWEEMLALSREVHDNDDYLTFVAMSNLAGIYSDYFSDARQREEGTKLRKEALELQRKRKGDRDPDTLSAMLSLADSLQHAGDYVQAETLLKGSVETGRIVWGPEHPRTFGALIARISNLRSLKQYDEAIVILKQTLGDMERVLPPDHPMFVNVFLEATKLYSSAGKTTEAIAMLKQRVAAYPVDAYTAMVLAVLQVWFGMDADHVSTCERVLSATANTLRSEYAQRAATVACLRPGLSKGLQDSALALARKSVELDKQKTSAGPYWGDMTLGMAEYRSGNYPAADESLREAIQAGRENEHVPATAGFYLAMSLFRQGKPEEALNTFIEAEARTLPLPADDGNRLVGWIGHDYVITWLAYKEAKSLLKAPPQPGHPQEEIAHLEQLLAVRQKVLGPDKPYTLSTMLSLADRYRTGGRANDAVTLGQSTLELFRQTSGETNAKTLNAMTELAISYRVAGKLPEAISLETDALRLKRLHLPPGDPMLLESLDNLATCYELSNRKPEAEPLRRELAELKAKAVGR